VYKYLLMSDEFIKKALEAIAADYVHLVIKRSELERQIAEIERQEAKLNLKLVSLAALCDEIPEGTPISQVLKQVSKTGLTDAVRAVLKAGNGWMTPKQVRDQVLKLGVNLDRYQNPLASIHTILGRLKDVEFGLIDEKKKIWGVRWIGPEESLWTKFQKLPPEEAEDAVAETAKKIVHDRLWGKSKKAGKVSRRKKKE
jgi:hypothetical protein